MLTPGGDSQLLIEELCMHGVWVCVLQRCGGR